MKFLKQYKMTIAIVAIFIVMVIIGHYVVTLLIPGEEGDVCIGRLDGIDVPPVSAETYEELKSTLKEQDFVSDVSTAEGCLLVKVFVTVNDDASLDQAKSLGGMVLEKFSDEQKGVYDFQLAVSKNNKEDASFPIIGSRHKCTGECSNEFVWTKDRG